ncbi:sugar transferase, partial [Francisella tularensis]|uniref:sugar transferase n=1 Tax=Francisella tularensis TaxID=263 RepID=UPI002381C8CA
MFYKVFKRLIDILLSFMGLLLLSPIFLIIIFMIKNDSKGPIFFKQKRYGK